MEFVNALVLALGLNSVGFVFAYWLKSDKLTDFMYGATFLAIAIFAYTGSDQSTAATILLTLVSLWSLRLAFFLLIRVVRNKRDKRFDEVRGSFWKFGRFWLFQAFTAWIIMIPTIYFYINPSDSFNGWMYAGLAVWLAGFVTETVADYQKYVFSGESRNKGKWIEDGLWGYSRHPNYLGEIMVWLGIYLFTLPALSLSASVISLASPVWITFILLFVTGIPKLEQYADEKWGNDPKYQSYKERVPLIIPRFKP